MDKAHKNETIVITYKGLEPISMENKKNGRVADKIGKSWNLIQEGRDGVLQGCFLKDAVMWMVKKAIEDA